MVCFESVGPDMMWKYNTVGPHKGGVFILQRGHTSIFVGCPHNILPEPTTSIMGASFRLQSFSAFRSKSESSPHVLRVKDLEYGTNIALGACFAEVLTCAGDFQPWKRSVLSEDFLA